MTSFGSLVRHYLLQATPLDVAARFLDVVDTSIEALCKMPHLGAPKQLKNPTLAGLRFWAVKALKTSSSSILFSVTPCASFAFCTGGETSRRFSNERRIIERELNRLVLSGRGSVDLPSSDPSLTKQSSGSPVDIFSHALADLCGFQAATAQYEKPSVTATA